MSLHVPRYPSQYLSSQPFQVQLATRAAPVLDCGAAHICSYVADEDVDIQVRLPQTIGSANVQPLRLGVTAHINNDTVRFRIPDGEHWSLQVDDLPPLHGFVSRPMPTPSGPSVRRFAAGQVHDVGLLQLQAGETLWIEPGAVLRGLIMAEAADDVHIGGGGLIHGVRLPDLKARPLGLCGCRNARIEDVTVFSQAGWAVVPMGCEDLNINNLHVISHGRGHDGLDLVNSRKVRVKGGFIHSGDDCIVIKARAQHEDIPNARWALHSCEDIRVEGVCLLNDGTGSNLEIGHELLTDRVGDIVFSDCDLLACHGPGAAISINNMGCSLVENVCFENIRVEHYYDRLINIIIDASRYSHTSKRGHIRNIALREIQVRNSIYNPGYSISLIGGCDAAHLVTDVRFQNVHIDDNYITSLDALGCYTRHVRDIAFS